MTNDGKLLELKDEKANETNKLRKFMTHVGFATIGYILAFDAAAAFTLYPLLSEKKIQKDALALKEQIAYSQNEIAYLKQKTEKCSGIYNYFINVGKRWESTIKEDQKYYRQVMEYMRGINQPRIYQTSQTETSVADKQTTPHAQPIIKNKAKQIVNQARERE